MIGAIPIPGKRCWANYCGSYGLPTGLEPRTPLVILEWAQFRGKVRDEQGRVWELNRVQIDAGFSIHLDGVEVHESHPKCAAYLRHKVEELKKILSVSADNWQSPVSRFDYQTDLSNTRWYLERNGFDPDGPLPPGPVPRATGSPALRRAPNPRLPVRNNEDRPRRMNS